MSKVTTVATWFIGGAADKNRFWFIGPKTNLLRDQLIGRYFDQISGTALGTAEQNHGIDMAYFGYDEMGVLFDAIRAMVKHMPGVQVRLVGHSLGAWQAGVLSERLAQAGITVALLITIDPVGIGYFMHFPGGQYALPRPMAKIWINLVANHTIQYSRDDVVADAGIRWRPSRDSALKIKPTHDIGTPYSHAEVWKMMVFVGTGAKSAWQILTANP